MRPWPSKGRRARTRRLCRDPQARPAVIVASSLGTVFEWYDFFIYGTLAAVLSQHFFPWAGATGGFLYTLAACGAGSFVRPFAAILLGPIGDRLGRKYTFLITITLMGFATAAVAVLPTYAPTGIAAPILLVLCRLLRAWRWAANMAARRSTSPSMRRATSAASTPASSRRA